MSCGCSVFYIHYVLWTVLLNNSSSGRWPHLPGQLISEVEYTWSQMEVWLEKKLKMLHTELCYDFSFYSIFPFLQLITWEFFNKEIPFLNVISALLCYWCWVWMWFSVKCGLQDVPTINKWRRTGGSGKVKNTMARKIWLTLKWLAA